MYAHRAGLPILASYEDAVAHYNEQVPYKRGRHKGDVPLGSNRRYDQCLITKDEVEVALTLYGYDIVKFRKSGEILINLCGYDTHSTRSFITCATPFTALAYGGVTYLKVGDNEYAFPDSHYAFVVKDRQVLNPQRETIYKLNRGALLDVMKPYRPFLEYVENMGKVMTIIKGDEANAVNAQMPDYAMREMATGKVIHRLQMPHVSMRYVRDGYNPMDLINTFFDKTKEACETENLETFYYHFLWLGASALAWNYYLQGFVCSTDSDNTVGKPMANFFKELVRHRYRDQVFTKEEVMLLKKSKNENRKYFRY